MNSKRLTLFLLLLLSSLFHVNAQKPLNEVIVEKGDTLILNKSTSKINQFIIRGVVVLSEDESINLRISKLIIDGGKLLVGNSKNPYQGHFSIILTSKNASIPSEISIKNKGSLLLYGAFEADQEIGEYPNEKNLKRSIIVKTETEENYGYITVKDAYKIQISGVRFENLGIKKEMSIPALSWFGTTDHQTGFINNSIFIDSKYTDLYLDKTSGVIENNVFISENGSSVICSPSGIGIRNTISANTIFNTSDTHVAAVATMNPYQSIKNNHLVVSDKVSGVEIKLGEGYENFKWNQPDSLFVLNGNVILRKATQFSENQKSFETTGILIDKFNHTGIWSTRNNTITYFDTGLINSSKNIVLDRYIIKNNDIGIVPGAAYVQNSTIELTSNYKKAGIKALWITNKYSVSSPKISNIKISNYPVGLAFDGSIENANYFEKIQFENTNSPTLFTNIDSKSYINDKDGSLFISDQSRKKLDANSTDSHDMHKHHQMGLGHGKKHAVKNESKSGYVIFPENSTLKAPHSSPVKNNLSMYASSENLFGTLIISTGFGMDDPVHEHNNGFETLYLKNMFNQKKVYLDKVKNRKEVFISANNKYSIDYRVLEDPLYDISFDWNAAPDSWVIVKVPYKHNSVYGMRSFGKLVDSSKNLQELEAIKKTTYYVDEVEKVVYVKIYNTEHYDSLVLYSSAIYSEIVINNKRVAIQMRTDRKNKRVILSYELAENVTSVLELNDYYGNTIQTLFEGVSENNKVTVSIDLEKYDVENNVFLYTLIVGDQKHKGPIHTY